MFLFCLEIVYTSVKLQIIWYRKNLKIKRKTLKQRDEENLLFLT